MEGMRECLGWLSNCSNEQSCPQNWLEHAVSEIPTRVECHVCGQSVAMVGTEEGLRSERGLAAFPTVPPMALPGSAPMPSMNEGPITAGAPTPEPARLPTPVPAQVQWVCTLANGEVIRVDKPSMVIGRSRTCDIVIASAKVSRQHASVSSSGGELWIEDLGSANGVWHDGEKVTRTKIGHGDTFTISDETLLFEAR